MTTLTESRITTAISLEGPSKHEAELLFKEAKRRGRLRRWRSFTAILSLLLVAGAGFGFTYHASGLTSPRTNVPASSSVTLANAGVLTCQGASVLRPRVLIITCADGYTQLTKTHWSSWSSSGAAGTTTFALNLCKPYCAASPMSYFPNSTVHLSSPRETAHGRLFSTLVVRYVAAGHSKVFRFSYRGDPSF